MRKIWLISALLYEYTTDAQENKGLTKVAYMCNSTIWSIEPDCTRYQAKDSARLANLVEIGFLQVKEKLPSSSLLNH